MPGLVSTDQAVEHSRYESITRSYRARRRRVSCCGASMLFCAASGGGSTRKRLARLNRDDYVQPNGEDGTEKRSERKGKRAIKTTLAGCNLLDDSIGLCAAFHGTVDDLLFGELAHGGSVCTPSAEGKGPMANSISRTIISYQRQKTRNEKKNEIHIRQNRLQPPSRRAPSLDGHAYAFCCFSLMRQDSADP
jgi:hypothetical protein